MHAANAFVPDTIIPSKPLFDCAMDRETFSRRFKPKIHSYPAGTSRAPDGERGYGPIPRGPPPPRYDFRLTRCWKLDGKVFEHRRLNRPEGFEPADCLPSPYDIDHLSHRATELGYIIVLEAYENLDSMRRKFGVIPGVILISDGGELIARGAVCRPWPCIHSVTRPTREWVKVDTIHDLSGIADPGPRLTGHLIRTEFECCRIDETPLIDFDRPGGA